MCPRTSPGGEDLPRDRRLVDPPPRRCTSCGRIGCCDNSPNRHATAHATDAGHPVIRSLEPHEDWFWCYVDEVAFMLPVESDS